MKRRLIWLAAALAAGGLATAIALSASGAGKSGSERDLGRDDGEAPLAAATHSPAGAPRTVSIAASSAGASPSTAGELRAWRVAGRTPSTPTTATVLTDDDCAPDRAGMSRCLNELRLRGGGRLKLRHPHRMSEVPCLEPGEGVRLRPS